VTIFNRRLIAILAVVAIAVILCVAGFAILSDGQLEIITIN
jgi:hypothetical protein